MSNTIAVSSLINTPRVYSLLYVRLSHTLINTVLMLHMIKSCDFCTQIFQQLCDTSFEICYRLPVNCAIVVSVSLQF